jgi:uncharacterized membrane protein
MFSLFSKKQMLDKQAQHQIVEAIKAAENSTTGEIRVFMEHHCEFMDPLDRAKEIFVRLKMHNTDAHNAILIYVALTDRQFALFGDTVIYEKAGGAEFWAKAADKLTGHLMKNEIAEGLANCILELGTALKAHFPTAPGQNKNQLPDEIVFGK